MCASYSQKSRKSHFDSFANKILTGIKEIVPDYAEKRAIWELFQNALDIIEGTNGHLSIQITTCGLLFEHNGRPFRDDNLGALIKQYSNGKDYGSNKSQTGQYGTGFLSTHVYGREIRLNGSVQVDDLSYRLLEDFTMDRTSNDVEILSQSLINQDDFIEKLCDKGVPILTQPRATTSFEYIASAANKLSITAMTEYLHTILPYVFCFNEKLSEVRIKDEKGLIIYKREESKENVLILSRNEEKISLQYLQDTQSNIRIIFPQQRLDFSIVPKLFLFYPLMETAESGINFLIHAQEFRPNRERDYLHLVAKNDDLQADVATNKTLLEKAYSLIIDKIKNDEKLDFLSVVNIRFIEGENAFEIKLKEQYIENVKPLKRIHVIDELVNMSQITFFDEEVLLLSDELLQSFYKVFGQFTSLPEFKDYIFLSQIACNWQKSEITGLNIFDLREIFKLISESTGGDYNKIREQQDYLKMIRCIETNVDLLNELTLIPNMHNKLTTFSQLVKWTQKEPVLIEVVDALHASISAHYLHKDYYFIDNLKAYSRVDFKDEFSKFCNELNDKLSKSYEIFPVDDCRFFNLSQYLCFFIGSNSTTPLNGLLCEFFKTEFALTFQQEFISSPTVDTNYLPAIKLLSRLYIRKLEATDSYHIKAKVSRLLELIKLLDSQINLREDLLDKLSCFPNQKYLLRAQSELKIDLILDEVFKDKYFNIIGQECRNNLVIVEFNAYLQHKDSLGGVQLGDEIETKLQASKKFIPVEKDTLPIVLDLIKHISIYPLIWNNWLPNIDKVKEEILMHKFQDQNTRTSLFHILSEDEEKINLLGELALIKDLNALVQAGKDKLKEQYRKDKHLEYVKEIGLLIQDMIQKQIDLSLKDIIALVESTKDEKLQNKEEQNGQDFIIYRGTEPIYYIEVKSRWDSEGIVALSKRQVECCARNPKKYAVVTVNVADYKSRADLKIDDISFDKLYEDIYINDDLSEEFETLIKENRTFERTLESSKLIEFRGHIPQDRIKTKGITFNDFIENLKVELLKSPEMHAMSEVLTVS